tara:strand:+ start:1113 stop:1268 length:156 start_codon:yes stop_codon:yes gene_type:complete
MANECDMCETTNALYYYPVEFPEDDGTTTTRYGCDMCIDEMHEFVDAKKEA